jgi:hypothetical protein
MYFMDIFCIMYNIVRVSALVQSKENCRGSIISMFRLHVILAHSQLSKCKRSQVCLSLYSPSKLMHRLIYIFFRYEAPALYRDLKADRKLFLLLIFACLLSGTGGGGGTLLECEPPFAVDRRLAVFAAVPSSCGNGNASGGDEVFDLLREWLLARADLGGFSR